MSHCPLGYNVFIGKLVFTPLATRLMLCQLFFVASVSEVYLSVYCSNFFHTTPVFINYHSEMQTGSSSLLNW